VLCSLVRFGQYDKAGFAPQCQGEARLDGFSPGKGMPRRHPVHLLSDLLKGSPAPEDEDLPEPLKNGITQKNGASQKEMVETATFESTLLVEAVYKTAAREAQILVDDVFSGSGVPNAGELEDDKKELFERLFAAAHEGQKLGRFPGYILASRLGE